MAQEYASNQPVGYKNQVQNVAIVGVAGTVGKHITESLLKGGKHAVTAITRHDSTNTLPSGVISKKVNYSKPETLIDALRGQDVLIITMNVHAPPDTQAKLIDAAAAAGVPWVLPNEFGSDPFDKEQGRDIILGPIKDKFREQIEQLGKSSWICITNGFWYEFSLGGGPARYGFDFKNRSLIMMDDGDIKINTTTLPQVGRAVASLLALKVLPDNEEDKGPTLSQFKNNAVFVSSFKINQQDMLDSVLRVSGDKHSDWTITRTTARERFELGKDLMKEGNMMGFAIQMYSRVFFPKSEAETNGNYEDTKGLHNDILGLAQEDLDEYTKIGIQMSADTY